MALTLVAVKLTDAELQALDDLVDVCEFKSRSECLRQALVELLMRRDGEDRHLDAVRIQRIAHPMRKKKRPADEEKDQS